MLYTSKETAQWYHLIIQVGAALKVTGLYFLERVKCRVQSIVRIESYICWRSYLVSKLTCSFRGLMFDSQQPYWFTAVSNSISREFQGSLLGTHVVHRNICKQDTHTHKILNYLKIWELQNLSSTQVANKSLFLY